MENPLLNIDWTDLRTQKATLLKIMNNVNGEDVGDLEGILELINLLQDYAVDELGISEMDVFDFELEESREENETVEHYFARRSAETIFQMHIEGTFLYEDDDITDNPDKTEGFVKSIVDDEKHADIIKARIRQSILKDIETRRNDFINDEGKFEYRVDMFDYGYEIHKYCKELFYKDKTRPISLCGNCGSDNIETKAWIKPNKGNTFVEDIPNDDECHCQDCNENTHTIHKDIPFLKKLIGFQVVSKNGDIHPHMDGSFCIYSLPQAIAILDNTEMDFEEQYKLLSIWSDDIEEPTFMFEGDPRNPKYTW